MNARKNALHIVLLAAVVLVAGVGFMTTDVSAAGKAARTLRVSISRALFRDLPEPVVVAAMEPLAQVLSRSTGMKGSLVIAEDGADLASKLATDVDIGVFDGIEFAWARHHQQALEPLMLAVNQEKCVRALVVTRAKDGMGDFADLEGKKLATPKNTRPHCHLFLAQQCRDAGSAAPARFLGQLEQAATAEEVLDDVVDSKFDAALVDNASFACYQQRKPARAQQLTVLVQSIEFPSAVVAYRGQGLDRATLGRIQKSLGELDESPLGKPLLTFWQLSSFEKAPEELNAVLERVVKDYPAPKAYGEKLRARR